jgi:hypothetical protein
MQAQATRGRKGLWVLALTAIMLVTVMSLMIASADQIPYGATQVWSAEPAAGIYAETSSLLGSPLIGGSTYGQDTGSLPAATLIHVGAR